MNTKSDDVAVKQAYDKWANDRDVLTNRTRMLIFGCALAALWGGLIGRMIVRSIRKAERS